MPLGLSYKKIALGGIGGFLAGTALTVVCQAAGLAAIAPGVPVVAFVPLFSFLGAVYEGLQESEKK